MNWKDVEGYFSYTNLYDLALKYSPQDSVFVEVGSWMGRSTCYMGEKIKNSSKNIKFYAVDTWDGSEEPQHKKTIEELKNNNITLLDVFNHNLKSCGVEEYVIPIQNTSLEVAKTFEDDSIDFLHIDASHDYENVIADIIAWYPKVKPGGFITGDDYVINWSGVVNAVNSYFKDKSLVLLDRQDGTISKVWLHQKQGEKMEVTLYAIAKNEEKNVEKFIENSKKFSNVVVVDTGSTDNTVSLLRDAGIQVYEHPQTRDEFDFSVARNQALSYVKTDWALSIDFNEEITDLYLDGMGVISDEFTAFKHLRYDLDDEGDVKEGQTSFVRFHRTQNYKWVDAIHESLMFIPSEDFSEETSVETTVKITKTISKSIDKQLFYLTICEREYKKNPSNTYFLWFILKHYYDIRGVEKFLKYSSEYLSLSKAYRDPVRIDVFIMSCNVLLSLDKLELAANYSFHAFSESMMFGSDYIGKSLMTLYNVGNITKNPNIIIFATAFNENTLNLPERKNAIEELYEKTIEKK